MKKILVLALVALAACQSTPGTPPAQDTVKVPKDTVAKIDSLINNAPDTLKAK
jgi:hypothetical protein